MLCRLLAVATHRLKPALRRVSNSSYLVYAVLFAEVVGGGSGGVNPMVTAEPPAHLGAGGSVAHANGAPPIDGWDGALVLGRRWFELRCLCVATGVDSAPAVDGTNSACEFTRD